VADTPSPIISVRGLVTRFGTQTIHDKLDLDVRRGEILALVGGSGSGKSVLLRTIIGLKRPEGGKVEIFGREIARLDDTARREMQTRWGVLFQNGALFSAQTVVLVTHDLDTLAAITDRIAVLVDKRIIVGTMNEVRANPHPWIKAYFDGPRGRAALPKAG
jgi:ABC-type transporter Mla maintaining outer membrane lipid asymmetry ATPase subunit MlaF